VSSSPPTEPRFCRTEGFLSYLDYFRATIVDRLAGGLASHGRAARRRWSWSGT